MIRSLKKISSPMLITSLTLSIIVFFQLEHQYFIVSLRQRHYRCRIWRITTTSNLPINIIFQILNGDYFWYSFILVHHVFSERNITLYTRQHRPSRYDPRSKMSCYQQKKLEISDRHWWYASAVASARLLP